MKSAYELALERMEQGGIERPDSENLTDEARERMVEARRRADAKLAELEILHSQEVAKTMDPVERERMETEYRAERLRVHGRREREIEKIRGA